MQVRRYCNCIEGRKPAVTFGVLRLVTTFVADRAEGSQLLSNWLPSAHYQG